MQYESDLFNYKRRKSSVVHIGNIQIGGINPICIQSMTNTSTMDTEKSVEQIIRIIEEGGEIVRLTAQGEREAANLANIHADLRSRGYINPLVADIHFNPKAADVAAAIVEKVRINPGNFVDSARSFKQLSYTDEEYHEELNRLRDRFLPLLEICRQHMTALRIGVNHGSLSDRIMSRYGDTPLGMVESCMEFLRICKEQNFENVVISIKASNTMVMVQTVRLLVVVMNQEGMSYPLHLGVTEAGDGEDGRVKSAVGIGALLNDGIGDTIRVSLSEEPEKEIPVARKLVDYICQRENHAPIKSEELVNYLSRENDCLPIRKVRNVTSLKNIPIPFVLATTSFTDESYNADIIVPEIERNTMVKVNGIHFYRVEYGDLSYDLIQKLKNDSLSVLILSTSHINSVGEQRAAIYRLMKEGCEVPIVLHRIYSEDSLEDLQIKAGADCGIFFIDGLVDGIWLQNRGTIAGEELLSISFGILQAARCRMVKTEYISCPSCGRTMFDLQQTLARIKEATSHLKGLKIGVMGCIVNGPGEMADADYGYVGAARGKVSLYKKKECIERNIEASLAVDKLIALIKENGDWVDK